MNVRGHFAQVSTTADIDLDHLETASVETTIQASSIRTHNEARDKDICSSRFLDVEKFPVITFKSTGVELSGEGRCTLAGDLTIKGNTHSVALHVMKTGEVNDALMGHRIAYSANAQINRKEFGLGFNLMLDGKFVVSDEIQIIVDGELVEQQQDAVEAAAS